MITRANFSKKRRQDSFLLFTSAILILSVLAGCGPSIEELEAIDYTPLPGDDWKVSTPAEQGLDPDLVAKMYFNAAKLDTIYSLLVIKNGHLVAEKYFNEGSVNQKALMQSASKSYISTLIGLALEQGCLTSLDQKLIEFFPEYGDEITDPRKEEITLRHMLQMRAGYPWEETHPDLFSAMFAGDNPPLMVHFPLTADPGTTFQYSNTTTAWLAAIVSRSCDTNLKAFSEEYLLEPIGAEMGDFWPNKYDDYYPLFHFSARDAAKYGLLYLNHGEFSGEQIVPADWVHDSLQTYSQDVSSGAPQSGKIGRYFRDIGYGYQWWSARVGDHHFNYAAGHGGQLIVLLHELDMIVVTTADPFWQQHDGQSWKHEKAIINLVGEFINSIPGE
ncbi:MAG: serine hydrolase domain-containing protein [Candidatus Thorarchaeota archaeon]